MNHDPLEDKARTWDENRTTLEDVNLSDLRRKLWNESWQHFYDWTEGSEGN